MDESNHQAQDTMESGVVQVEKENKKKWKIPRVSSGPMCYSMYEWSLRMSFVDMILGGGLAYLFFYLSTRVDRSIENYQVGETMSIIFGVIFCIVAFFGLLLTIGLCCTKFKVLIRVYCWYATIFAVIVFILFFISAIFVMVNSGEIGTGFLAILIAVLVSGYMLYNACVVYSVHMNIIEGKEEINLKTSGCQDFFGLFKD